MNVNGIKIEKLKVIKNQDGDILKFLSKKSKSVVSGPKSKF